MNAVASLITWPGVYETSLCLMMKRACRLFDIDLQNNPLFDGCTGSMHSEMIKASPNVISWVCFARSEEELKFDRNLLFFENGLLDRGLSYYLDDNGYGASSNIVAKGYNNHSYDDSYVKEVFDYLRSLRWPIGVGSKADGPIMIALQYRKNEDEELLAKCKKYLPKKSKVIIRCHPKTKDPLSLYSKYLDNGWEIDVLEDVFDSLARCRGVVVNSSSIIFKALAMGIPVAACKRGFHSGTAAVMDCSRNEKLLQFFIDYRFEERSSQNLICAIKENSISKNISSIDELLKNSNFANWLKRIRIP
jgi:hypothetical protein